MNHADNRNTVAIIATYFGALPPYFDLWLTSCRFNPNYDWLVFTDADWSEFAIPGNVHMQKLSLSGFSRLAASTLDLRVDFNVPYKVCDFRPAFWMLLPLAGKTYDFWGHCDLDMVFGDLSRFITDGMLRDYDKIFSVGHLTLYRNSETANRMFQRSHPELDWRDILSDSKHRGFDEHIGVNRIWRLHGGRMFADESLIADLDPHVKRLELLDPRRNRSQQMFYFDKGRVLQGFYDSSGNWTETEFMYAHFQKRKMVDRRCDVNAQSFVFTPGGFDRMPLMPPNRSEVRSYNSDSMLDRVHEAKHRVRRYVKKIRESSVV